MTKCCARLASSGELIEIEFDSVIQHVDSLLSPCPDDDTWIAPSFIDLQVNGFAGADFNSPATSPESIAAACAAIFSTGVARFFPTVITGPPERMCAALRNLAGAREVLPDGGAMEAFHVEGPYISPEEGPRGAHPKAWVRPPDFDEFRRLQEAADGNIRLMTLAPEWPQAPAFIEKLTSEGVVAAIGHTRATPDQIRAAVHAGATLSTHLGNAADPQIQRRDNFLYAQLAEDRLAASFIADGHHLADSFLQIALRSKGLDQSLLVTDAAMPAMCPPGQYMLGEVVVELKPDQRVVLRGGDRLAGSSLRMDQAVSNVIRRAHVNLAGAITMATTNPARVGRVSGRLRGIRPGERADLVVFRLLDGEHAGGIEVIETYVSGRRVFAKPE